MPGPLSTWRWGQREDEPAEGKGWSIVYSRQYPWVARLIEESRPVFEEFGLRPRIQELTTAADAQQAPNPYGVFSLIHDGRLLVNRCSSTTRLANILKKAVR